MSLIEFRGAIQKGIYTHDIAVHDVPVAGKSVLER